jgi:hypothetical protein
MDQLSAFGIDHGYSEVEKIANPINALRTFGGAAKTAAGPVKVSMASGGGAHRAAGMSSVPKPAGAIRQATAGLGASVSGGLKQLGAKVSGASGKRAVPTMRSRAGGALTGLGQKSFNHPIGTGAAALGAGGAAVGGGGVAAGNAFGGRRRQP